MTAGRYASAYVGMLVTFLALDKLWLGLAAREFYRRQLAMANRKKVSVA